MKIYTIFVLDIIVIMFSFYGFASELEVNSCGYNNIEIFYKTKADYILGCEGIARVKSFFTTYGYAVDIPVRIHFKQQGVTVNVNNFKQDQKLVYACFDPKTMSVYMSSLVSPFVTDPERVYFRIDFREKSGIEKQKKRQIIEEFHRTVVAHEVAHLFAQHNFNRRSVEHSLSLKNGTWCARVYRFHCAVYYNGIIPSSAHTSAV